MWHGGSQLILGEYLFRPCHRCRPQAQIFQVVGSDMVKRYGVEEDRPIVDVGRRGDELPAAAPPQRYSCNHEESLGQPEALNFTRSREALAAGRQAVARDASCDAMVDFLTSLTLLDLMRSWEALDTTRRW